MTKFRFKGVVFVSNVTITVEAHTRGEAIGILAREEDGGEIDLDSGTIEYSWADLNSAEQHDP